MWRKDEEIVLLIAGSNLPMKKEPEDSVAFCKHTGFWLLRMSFRYVLFFPPLDCKGARVCDYRDTKLIITWGINPITSVPIMERASAAREEMPASPPSISPNGSRKYMVTTSPK